MSVIKMNKRKAARIVSFCCIIIAVLLCFFLLNTSVFNPSQIYDNERLLASESDNYHETQGVIKNPDGQFSFGKFSGSRTVEIINLDAISDLSFEWNIVVEKGSFKIVLVDIRNEKVVETICEGSDIGNVEVLDLPPGAYRVKFAGKNATAKGEFDFAID